MPRQYRTAEIVEGARAAFTPLFLSRRLGPIPTLLCDRRRTTVRAAHALGPAQLPDGFVTLDIIQQILRVDHRQGTEPSVTAVRNPFRVAPNLRQGELFSTVRNPD